MTLQQNIRTEEIATNAIPSNPSAEDKPSQPQMRPAATLERLKQQQKMLANRISQLESRQRQNERKQETRRKILVGAYFLDKARQTGHMGDLIKQLSTFLTRDSDRALFDLPIERSEEPSK